MKSPVQGIIVFFGAVLTHYELVHGGIWPVIGYLLYNCKSWSAVGTVGKWIIISPIVLFIFNISSTETAGCNIRRDQLEFFFRFNAFSYFKILKILEVDFFYFCIFNNRS